MTGKLYADHILVMNDYDKQYGVDSMDMDGYKWDSTWTHVLWEFQASHTAVDYDWSEAQQKWLRYAETVYTGPEQIYGPGN